MNNIYKEIKKKTHSKNLISLFPHFSPTPSWNPLTLCSISVLPTVEKQESQQAAEFISSQICISSLIPSSCKRNPCFVSLFFGIQQQKSKAPIFIQPSPCHLNVTPFSAFSHQPASLSHFLSSNLISSSLFSLSRVYFKQKGFLSLLRSSRQIHSSVGFLEGFSREQSIKPYTESGEMYPYTVSSSILRCQAMARSSSAALLPSSSLSLISLFATKPVSLLCCYGGLGQLSGASRSEDVKSFSTDSPRVPQGYISGHPSQNFARKGGFARTSGWSSETERGSKKSMNFVRGIIEEDGKDFRGSQPSRYNNVEQNLHIKKNNVEQNADIVHLKLLRNNTFVTVTDSKGNTKCKASAGCLPELKGGAKMSRYAAEATSEHVGRMSRNMGLKSVVMKVKGFTYFKKKRQAIMSWREGFTNSRGVQNPIVYVEDTTRRPHNGCRLPKKRRI